MEQHTLSFPTDTSVPHSPIPIFYMHEGDHPLCLNEGCICHVNDAKLKELMQGVIDGELKLRKAYNGCMVGRSIQ
jgi:hypothetical protein